MLKLNKSLTLLILKKLQVILQQKTKDISFRLFRENTVVHEGKLKLAKIKDEVKEVNGLECGMGLENYNDIKVGDVMECFELKEIKNIIINIYD